LIKVLSIHWGFSIGGVAQYAANLELVRNHAPITLSTACILNRRRHVDEQTLGTLGNLTVIERRGPWDVRWLREVSRLITTLKPDLILTHGFNGHFAALLGKTFVNSPATYICSYHGKYHPPTTLKRMVSGIYNGFTEYYMRNHASDIASVADYCKRYLVERKVFPGKITVTHNGISNAFEHLEMEKARAELGIPNEGMVVGVMSRLDPEKGVKYLLEAYQGVSRYMPDVYLVVIGVGAQEAYLKQLAVELGVSKRVVFAGFRSNAARYLPALDVFVLPSLAEYHSIGLLEAMRAARAIVATDVGGNTESIRHCKEGLVVRPGDSVGLENALKSLLASVELRQGLGQAARERFEQEFTIEAMAKESAQWLIAAANRDSTSAFLH
jgi:glycosyltransferase involved in cell wall biosynthesis